MRIKQALFGAFFVALSAGGAVADTLVSSLPSSTTSPLPANSCMYVDMGSATDTKACGAAGAYWASLFGVVPATRSVSTGSLLSGGGALSGDLTLNIASIAANSLVMNATGSGAVPTAVAVPACADSAGQHLNYSSGAFSCGTSGSGLTTNGVLGDIMRSNGAGGFGTALTPGSGVAAFLASPAGAVVGSWLNSTAVADSLGYTPVTNARTVSTSGLLTGGGDLADNRTISIAAMAANTVAMNATGSSAVPTAVTIPACPDSGGNHLNYASGVFSCGTSGSGVGGAITFTDTNNPVPNVTTATFNPKNFVVSSSVAGEALVSFTYTIGADQSGGNYTFLDTDSATMIPIGASHTYDLAQAGTTGFEAGWSACVQNISASGNATVSTTTSVFKGAGGGTSFILEAGGWACFASSGGNWFTQVGHFNTLPGAIYNTGSLFPTALSGNVDNYNPTGLADASALFIDGGASARNITGIAGGAAGRMLTVTNNGANNLTLVNNATSTTGNRFQLSADTVLPPNTSVTLRYDESTSRWRPLTRTLSNTGVSAGAYTCSDITVGTDGRLTSAASGSCTGSAVVNVAFAPIGWIAGVDPNKAVIMTATTSMTVTAIRGTVDDAVGSAATVAIYKAPSGTACASGTIQHSGTFDANGTADTNQTLTLAGGGANGLSAGDRLCLVTTGGANWTGGSGIGGLTVAYTTP